MRTTVRLSFVVISTGKYSVVPKLVAMMADDIESSTDNDPNSTNSGVGLTDSTMEPAQYTLLADSLFEPYSESPPYPLPAPPDSDGEPELPDDWSQTSNPDDSAYMQVSPLPSDTDPSEVSFASGDFSDHLERDTVQLEDLSTDEIWQTSGMCSDWVFDF